MSIGSTVEPGTRPITDLGNMGVRKIIRRPRNPLDVATIVSIYPCTIKEEKPTIFPGHLTIEKGSYEKPSVTLVEPASFFEDSDPDGKQPLREIPISATELAESYINDYCKGLLGFVPGISGPGMFYVNGNISELDVSLKYKDALETAQVRQLAWFKVLIDEGDALWSKHNGNPRVIWDMMKTACQVLGLDKPWLKNFQAIAMVKCIACGNLRDPNYPVCASCKFIDPSHPASKSLMFAK